ncbi:MAG: Dienelactone hydrolase family, partial [uncultured Corynebacteriales bacterium]
DRTRLPGRPGADRRPARAVAGRGGGARRDRRERRHAGAGRLAGRRRLPRRGPRPVRRQGRRTVPEGHVRAAQRPAGTAVRPAGRGPAGPRRPPGLHRDGRGDRVLHGRRVRAAARRAARLVRRERQLRPGAGQRGRRAGRCLPAGRQLRRPGPRPAGGRRQGPGRGRGRRRRRRHHGVPGRRAQLPQPAGRRLPAGPGAEGGRGRLPPPVGGRRGTAHPRVLRRPPAGGGL